MPIKRSQTPPGLLHPAFASTHAQPAPSDYRTPTDHTLPAPSSDAAPPPLFGRRRRQSSTPTTSPPSIPSRHPARPDSNHDSRDDPWLPSSPDSISRRRHVSPPLPLRSPFRTPRRRAPTQPPQQGSPRRPQHHHHSSSVYTLQARVDYDSPTPPSPPSPITPPDLSPQQSAGSSAFTPNAFSTGLPRDYATANLWMHHSPSADPDSQVMFERMPTPPPHGRERDLYWDETMFLRSLIPPLTSQGAAQEPIISRGDCNCDSHCEICVRYEDGTRRGLGYQGPCAFCLTARELARRESSKMLPPVKPLVTPLPLQPVPECDASGRPSPGAATTPLPTHKAKKQGAFSPSDLFVLVLHGTLWDKEMKKVEMASEEDLMGRMREFEQRRAFKERCRRERISTGLLGMRTSLRAKFKGRLSWI